MLGTTGAPEESHIGIRASPPKKVTGLMAQLRCLYASAGHMDSSGGAVAELLSQRHAGMTGAAGVLQWVAINSSERMGKEGEVVGYPCMLVI